MKTVWVLIHDYWHPAETVRPLAARLFPEEQWRVILSEDPGTLLGQAETPDLIVSLKDPVENNQIPTPTWCDERWTDRLFGCVRDEGTGFLAIHAALAGTDREHPIIREMIQAVFTGHPAPCPLTFRPLKEHPILEGIPEFTLPGNDEHYMMAMLDGAQVDLLAQTVSEHGAQPGLWVKEYGRGRVCCVTPGHTTGILLCEDYLKVLRQAAAWCVGEEQ